MSPFLRNCKHQTTAGADSWDKSMSLKEREGKPSPKRNTSVGLIGKFHQMLKRRQHLLWLPSSRELKGHSQVILGGQCQLVLNLHTGIPHEQRYKTGQQNVSK